MITCPSAKLYWPSAVFFSELLDLLLMYITENIFYSIKYAVMKAYTNTLKYNINIMWVL